MTDMPPMLGLAVHIPGLLNPRLTLCQEAAMMRGAFDDLARVNVDLPGIPVGDRRTCHPPFAALLARHRTRADAVRAVESCAWLSRDDFLAVSEARELGIDVLGPAPCRACREQAGS